jgi:hypothetical protein
MPAPKNFKGRPGSGKVRQFYWPRCSVCQYMKNNEQFRTAVMRSTYFKPDGVDSLAQVLRDFNDPFKLSTVYLHMQRHQESDLMLARKRFAKLPPEKKIILPGDNVPGQAIAVVEGDVVSQEQHELGLDEFIRKGREMLEENKLPITATTYLQAIKIKSDNNKSAKDRRMEMIKQFFSGGSDAKT